MSNPSCTNLCTGGPCPTDPTQSCCTVSCEPNPVTAGTYACTQTTYDSCGTQTGTTDFYSYLSDPTCSVVCASCGGGGTYNPTDPGSSVTSEAWFWVVLVLGILVLAGAITAVVCCMKKRRAHSLAAHPYAYNNVDTAGR